MEVLEQFGIDWRLLVIQVINFLVLMLILKKLLYKPVMTMLEKRRSEVAASVQAAEDMQKAKDEFSKQAAKEMEAVRQKAHDVTARADETATNIKEQAQEDAKIQAQGIVASAKKEIATEKVLGQELEGSHEGFIQREVSAKK